MLRGAVHGDAAVRTGEGQEAGRASGSDAVELCELGVSGGGCVEDSRVFCQTLLYRTVGLTLRRSTVLLSSPNTPRP